MYLGEIPKTDKIVISFDIRDKHFDFTTDMLPFVSPEDSDNTVFCAPIIIKDNVLHMDNRCRNVHVRYLNALSGRLHVWRGVTVTFSKKPQSSYILQAKGDSTPVNRRHSIRIPVGYKSACTISLIKGKYPCVVNDISITGIGINIGSELAEKKVEKRQIYTEFEDEILKKRFYVKANILHTFKLNATTVRCGCEIINVTPSLNEYINVKQTHSLARAANFNDALNKGLNGLLADDTDLLSGNAEDIFADDKTADETASVSYTPSFIKPAEESKDAADDDYWIKDGGLCPICEKGTLRFVKDAFYCYSCGSILE